MSIRFEFGLASVVSMCTEQTTSMHVLFDLNSVQQLRNWQTQTRTHDSWRRCHEASDDMGKAEVSDEESTLINCGVCRKMVNAKNKNIPPSK